MWVVFLHQTNRQLRYKSWTSETTLTKLVAWRGGASWAQLKHPGTVCMYATTYVYIIYTYSRYHIWNIALVTENLRYTIDILSFRTCNVNFSKQPLSKLASNLATAGNGSRRRSNHCLWCLNFQQIKSQGQRTHYSYNFRISAKHLRVLNMLNVTCLSVTNSLETKVKLELWLLFWMTLLDCNFTQVFAQSLAIDFKNQSLHDLYMYIISFSLHSTAYV